jgi:hypothetical protein
MTITVRSAKAGAAKPSAATVKPSAGRMNLVMVDSFVFPGEA